MGYFHDRGDSVQKEFANAAEVHKLVDELFFRSFQSVPICIVFEDGGKGNGLLRPHFKIYIIIIGNYIWKNLNGR